MRNLLALVFVSFALAGCFRHETVERQPVVVSPPASNTVVVPQPGRTVVCPTGSVC
jgi:uncharacterized protein YcfL